MAASSIRRKAESGTVLSALYLVSRDSGKAEWRVTRIPKIWALAPGRDRNEWAEEESGSA
jgi:hypothetical protein